MKLITIACLFVFCSFTALAQENKDPCTLKISLLTCAPGSDLYSLFGHTAIRIQDTLRGIDIIYNYGTFDDTDPLFYVHFTRGIMSYSLSAETFENFMVEYQNEHRSVVAQVLNLNCAEKKKLYEALRINTLEENRIYPYHFHTDNCTTRAGRIIETQTNDSFHYQNILPVPGPSFRDMIHEYLYRQNQYWPAFGIDMLMGANLDVKTTNVEAIHFLPDYLFRGLDSARSRTRPMVMVKETLLHFSDSQSTGKGLTPFIVFLSILFINILLFFFRNKQAVGGILQIFDIIFFSLLGLIGILMAYVWLGRVDDVCRNNINILWALPSHIVAVFFLRTKVAWVKYYFLLTAALAALLAIGFVWWPQKLNGAVLPLLGLILFRGFQIFLNRKDAEKSIIQG